MSDAAAVARATWTLQNPCATRQHLLSATKPFACRRVAVGPDGDEALFPMVVAPGETVTLVFELDPRLSSGRIGGYARVRTDDAQHPELRAGFRGKIVEAFVLKPGAIDLGVLEPTAANATEAEALVEREDGQSFRIVEVHGCPSGLVASCESLDEDRRWRVRLAAHRIEVQGQLDARLTFVTDDGSRLAYRVLGRVPWSIDVNPGAALYLGVVAPGGSTEQRIELRSRSPVDWEKLATAWRWHDAELHEIEPKLTTKVHDALHADVLVTLQASLVGITQDRAVHGVVGLCLPDGSRPVEVHAYGFLRTRP